MLIIVPVQNCVNCVPSDLIYVLYRFLLGETFYNLVGTR